MKIKTKIHAGGRCDPTGVPIGSGGGGGGGGSPLPPGGVLNEF
ncbi:MAG TPA: hypothetical protein VH083_23355 [Myxococcales bacterium]|jgi:hypothetical protein|nr:hypothetical protein [Myxococcales bacterium]